MRLVGLTAQWLPSWPTLRTIDLTYNFISNALQKECFSDGWGDHNLIKSLLELAEDSQKNPAGTQLKERLITKNIDIVQTEDNLVEDKQMRVITANFVSPSSEFMPPESRNCYIQLITHTDHDSKIPLCVHFAMTGDHGFSRRQALAKSLLKKNNIASVIIMNPFYGARRPKIQDKSSLLHVSDIMVKGVGLVTECLSLIEYLKNNDDFGNFGPFGVTGMSMGGHMAALTACNSMDELACIPCIAPYSASPVFTEGSMSSWCDWKKLEHDLPDYLSEEQKRKGFTAKDYMRYLFDITTDLRRYPVVRKPSAAIQVAASHDEYVPGTGRILYEHWKGSELRWINHSHVSGFVLGQAQFVAAIVDAFERLQKE